VGRFFFFFALGTQTLLDCFLFAVGTTLPDAMFLVKLTLMMYQVRWHVKGPRVRTDIPFFVLVTQGKVLLIT
jgi:hypothetical protein